MSRFSEFSEKFKEKNNLKYGWSMGSDAVALKSDLMQSIEILGLWQYWKGFQKVCLYSK